MSTITLRCPTCGRTQENTKRRDTDPPTAVVREFDCPDHGEGWREVKWFDAAGQRVSIRGAHASGERDPIKS